jgi:hypothetical protein
MLGGMNTTYGHGFNDHRQMYGVCAPIEESDRPAWFYALAGISLFLLKIVLTACLAITLAGAHGDVATVLGFIAGFVIWMPR